NKATGTAETGIEIIMSGDQTMVARRMLETGEPVAIADTQKDAGWADDASRPDVGAPIRSYIGAPIRVDSELVGILSVYSTQPNTFNVSYMNRLAVFTDQVGIA